MLKILEESKASQRRNGQGNSLKRRFDWIGWPIKEIANQVSFIKGGTVKKDYNFIKPEKISISFSQEKVIDDLGTIIIN